jgi:hypothetical protein
MRSRSYSCALNRSSINSNAALRGSSSAAAGVDPLLDGTAPSAQNGNAIGAVDGATKELAGAS